MSNKKKNTIIIIETITILCAMIYIILTNINTRSKTKIITENLNSSNIEDNYEEDYANIKSEEKEYIKTYNVIQKIDLSDETGNYDYYVIKQFQDNEPVLIRVKNKYILEEGENYEIILYGAKKEGKSYSQREIFEEFEIINITKTDKIGLEQTQEF